MINITRYQLWGALAACLLALLFAAPNVLTEKAAKGLPSYVPHQQFNLGLDLQGGAYLLLESDMKPVTDDHLRELRNQVRTKLRDERIRYEELRIVASRGVSFKLVDRADATKAQDAVNRIARDSSISGGTFASRQNVYDIRVDGDSVSMRLTDAGIAAINDRVMEQAMATLSGLGTLNSNRVTVAKMHCDLIALAFSCDFARAATLQIGDGNDSTQYTINGVTLPYFHQISHRIYGDGSEGDPIVGAVDMHHDIDRLFLQIFKHLLDRLDSYGILDQSIAVNVNDLGAGVSHSFSNLPWIIAGAGDGLLKQGQFVDVGGAYHNRLLNTLISAVGIRDGGGDLVSDFGDPSLPGGTLSELMV